MVGDPGAQLPDSAAGWLAPLGGAHLRSGESTGVQHPHAVTAAAELGEQCAFELTLIAPRLPPFDAPTAIPRTAGYASW